MKDLRCFPFPPDSLGVWPTGRCRQNNTQPVCCIAEYCQIVRLSRKRKGVIFFSVSYAFKLPCFFWNTCTPLCTQCSPASMQIVWAISLWNGRTNRNLEWLMGSRSIITWYNTQKIPEYPLSRITCRRKPKVTTMTRILYQSFALLFSLSITHVFQFLFTP